MVAGEERERGDGYRTVELSDFAMILGSSNWRMTGGLDVIIESFSCVSSRIEINHLFCTLYDASTIITILFLRVLFVRKEPPFFGSPNHSPFFALRRGAVVNRRNGGRWNYIFGFVCVFVSTPFMSITYVRRG